MNRSRLLVRCRCARTLAPPSPPAPASPAPPLRPLPSAFTLIELAAVILVSAVLVGLLLPALSPRRHICGRQLKDSTQVRGIIQSMIVWAGNNNSQYPLPSIVDCENATVGEIGAEKDTTANILSLMIFNGLISPEICVSPQESNTASIEKMDDYALTDPFAAVIPSQALWDPAFRADFTDPQHKANNSYAHLLPSGARLSRWKDNFEANEAVFGNRGPRVAGVTRDRRGTPTITWSNSNSYTFLIHGGRTTWEGNIGYNDSHVAFETKAYNDSVTYKPWPTGGAGRTGADRTKPLTPEQLAAIKPIPDVLFDDEPDDAEGTNAFLGIFTKAGEKPGEFKAIWD